MEAGGLRIGMLFPGQGSQAVGMGADLVEAFPLARAVFETADAVSGTTSRSCVSPVPGGRSRDATRAAGAARAFGSGVSGSGAHGVTPAVVAGHSSGVFGAGGAGALDFEAALHIVRRGRADVRKRRRSSGHHGGRHRRGTGGGRGRLCGGGPFGVCEIANGTRRIKL